MSWWYVGAAVVSAAGGAYASDKAADEVGRGNNAAIAEQGRQFDTVMGLQQPYTVTGTGAMNKLARLYGLPYQEYQAPDSGGAGGAYSNPRLEKGQRLSHRNVRRLLRQGTSVDDIVQYGYLGGRLNSGRIKKLKKLGATDADIAKLMGGPSAERAAAGQDEREIITPDGPDMSEFVESPDYQINLRESQEAVDRTAAARSGALSGNAVMAAQENASDLASGEFSNFFSRLATIAGIGQGAANTASQAAQNTGQTVSSLLASTGQARASGIMGAANSVSGALDSGLTNWMLQRNGYFDPPGAA